METFITYVFVGYDGPLQYTMSHDNNPDQVISVLSNSNSFDGN